MNANVIFCCIIGKICKTIPLLERLSDQDRNILGPVLCAFYILFHSLHSKYHISLINSFISIVDRGRSSPVQEFQLRTFRKMAT